ncbi:hypothetical protein [Sulfurimonas sp.]|uniref:hypothetical protein n=1 Tax=Sulfurimonas sp. TaxID=2022749 RepID=UPI0035676C14
MDYSFSITGLLKEAFDRSYGVKGTIVGASLIYGIVAVIISAILELVFPSGDSFFNGIIQTLISAPITVPIMVGVTFLGINHARGLDINIPSIFDYFGMMVPIITTFILMYICLIIGFTLLILPGIYLAVSYTFAYQLVADKGLGAWEAMELSRKTVTKQWFKFFGLGLLSALIIILSIIPLGIGLIWSIPTVYIAYGLLYHHIFDDEEV